MTRMTINMAKTTQDKTKITETKEKILNTLEGGFEVTKVERDDWDGGVAIKCEFIIKGKRGSFGYDLEGGESGIDQVDYEESDDDDFEIYDEIHNWIDKNIEWKTSVKWNGKEVI